MAEAREILSTVSRLAQPTSKADLYVLIQPLVIMYGVPDFGQDDEAAEMQKAWFDILYDACKENPREALEIAVSECIRLNKYSKFPMPAYLNELAEEAKNEIRLVAFRLKYAVEKADQHRPIPKRTPEDAAAVKKIVEDMKGADGKIHLAKSTASTIPPTNRQATSEALRRLRDYQ